MSLREKSGSLLLERTMASVISRPISAIKRDMRRVRKPYVKAAFRGVLFLSVAVGFSMYSFFFLEQDNFSSDHHRRLQEEELVDAHPECLQSSKADPEWFAAIYFLGVLYTFLAIAIVCDELFVPALEEIASERHLNLSMDVAGATLMAAGGSAPELFTSIFGTFIQKSEVGIGTVVGSAVFNVLFVIAMCALLTKEVLALTWWPLIRDSFCYSLGLIMLGLFVGVISPNEIEMWEAIVLFLMYIGYVIIMYFNRRIYKKITGVVSTMHTAKEDKDEENDVTDHPNGAADGVGNGYGNDVPASNASENSEPQIVGDAPIPHHSNRSASSTSTPRRSLRRGPSLRSLDESMDLHSSVGDPHANMIAINEDESFPDLTPWPGTFRSGVLKILRNPESWKEDAGIGIVAVMAGDVHHVFRQVDVDDSGDIDKEELEHLFAKLECSVPPEELDQVMEELDENKDGKITEEDFVKWYVHSEKRITMRTRLVFDFFDTEKDGKITKESLKKLLKTVEPAVTDEDVDQAMLAMYQTGSKDEITFEEFSNWYLHSLIYQKRTKKIEEDIETIFESVYPPEVEGGGCLAYVLAYTKYLLVLPIVIVLAFTVPDVRRPGWSKYCYVSFSLSIIWIGFFSFYMVDWAEVIGHTIGIPSVIMGLTLLAAGTSVPDLLTSVIVARMGEGDMALSSSIGSNIFDILVGLPVPWIAYTAWKDEPITVRFALQMRICVLESD
jgi:K+-dependent Na+/Ca+ exchanger-like protein